MKRVSDSSAGPSEQTCPASRQHRSAVEKVYKAISVLGLALLAVGCVINMIKSTAHYYNYYNTVTGFPLEYILIGVLLKWLIFTAISAVIYFAGRFIIKRTSAKKANNP